MIKWEHSVFALPFALCGAMLAATDFNGASIGLDFRSYGRGTLGRHGFQSARRRIH